MSKLTTIMWNPETLQYFYDNKRILKHDSIENFVKYECDLEENETIEMLVNDIKNQINKL